MENLDKNTYNEIDKFFQSKLNEGVLVNESWNTPPKQVLDNALDIVNANTGQKRKKYWLLLLLLLSGGVLFLVIWNSVSINQIHQKLETTIYKDLPLNQTNSQETFFEEKKNKVDLVNDKTQKQKAIKSTPTGSKKQASSYQNAVEQNLNNSISNKKKKNGTKNNFFIKNETTNKKVNHSENSIPPKKKVKPMANKVEKLLSVKSEKSPSIENKDQPVDNKYIKNNTAISAPVKLVKKTNASLTKKSNYTTFKKHNFSPVPLLLIINGNIKNTIQNQLSAIQKTGGDIPLNKYHKQSKYWTVYTLFGVNYSKQRMTNLPKNLGFTLLEYDKSYLGFESGIGIKYQFTPRLNTNATISFSRINNNSVYEDQTDYDTENEFRNDDGSTTYKSDYAVETTISGYQGQYNFDVSDPNIDQVDNKTNIKQVYQFYNTSLGLEYSVLHKNKLKVNIGTGTGLSYLANVNQHLDVNVSNGEKSLFEDRIAISSTKEMNRFSVFTLGTVSINYSITPKIDLGLNNQYCFGLTSVRKINSLNDPKTFNESFRILLTAEYNFR